MAGEPLTFCDHTLSLLQSTAREAIRASLDADHLGSGCESGSDFARATALIGALKMRKEAVPETVPPGLLQSAWKCARLGYDLLQAKIACDAAAVLWLTDELWFGACDEKWTKALTSYLDYVGSDGRLRAIPYVRAAQVGNRVLPLQPSARVALIADWGTGTDGQIYRHSFTTIQFGQNGSAAATYYDSAAGTAPIFSETL